MLCLSNGERIKLAAGMHMMFEVNDLSVASPATVSRCGMVFMEAVYIGMAPYITSWCQNTLPKKLPQHGARLQSLLTKYALPAIEFMREECKEGTPSQDAQLLRSLFNLLDSTLRPEHGVTSGKGGVEGMINLWFVYAFVWALGGNLRDESRSKFDAYVRDCGILKELDPSFPKDGTVFDYCVSAQLESFVTWASLTPPFNYTPGMPYFNILVPTGETTCYDFMLKVLVENSTHVMIVGETGTGKSVLVQGFLARLPHEKSAIQAAFSAQTAAKNMQDLLESKLDKLRKNLLGAPPGRQTVRPHARAWRAWRAWRSTHARSTRIRARTQHTYTHAHYAAFPRRRCASHVVTAPRVCSFRTVLRRSCSWTTSTCRPSKSTARSRRSSSCARRSRRAASTT